MGFRFLTDPVFCLRLHSFQITLDAIFWLFNFSWFLAQKLTAVLLSGKRWDNVEASWGKYSSEKKLFLQSVSRTLSSHIVQLRFRI